MNRKILLTVLAVLLLAGCCGKHDDTELYLFDSNSKLPPLEKSWKADLNELPYMFINRKKKLRRAIKRLRLPARASFREILDAITSRRVQAEFLFDLSEFPLKKIWRIFVIILRMYEEEPEALKAACAAGTKASLGVKLRVHALEKKLSPEDQKLFDELEEKLALPNLPDSDFTR